jgi:hypothetical protein
MPLFRRLFTYFYADAPQARLDRGTAGIGKVSRFKSAHCRHSAPSNDGGKVAIQNHRRLGYSMLCARRHKTTDEALQYNGSYANVKTTGGRASPKTPRCDS